MQAGMKLCGFALTRVRALEEAAGCAPAEETP